MGPRNRVIIDTDPARPGVDDVLAILLALSSSAADLEIVLISVTYGNIDVHSALRNVVSIFHVLEKELQWRAKRGLPIGFEGMTKYKPLVAVGATEPLVDRVENADYFHGIDGLGGIHTTHPHLSPEETWKELFEEPQSDSVIADPAKDTGDAMMARETSFTPTLQPAHEEILRVLRENEPDTITILAIGPLTNCALAAAQDRETFLRVKEVVSMGGAVDSAGNVSPVAEFNVFADALAAARVYALSSPNPSSTMPLHPTSASPRAVTTLGPYPLNLSRPLHLTLFSLDITEAHSLSRRTFRKAVGPALAAGSPLAEWLSAFMEPILSKMEALHTGHVGDGAALALHDPLTVWYVLTRGADGKQPSSSDGWRASPTSPEDIRVETTGQWTKGMTLLDRRDRHRRGSDGPVPHDRDNWLGSRSGNRIVRMRSSGWEETFGAELMRRVLSGVPRV